MNQTEPEATAERPSKSQVQTALERLRKETMIWNAGRGIWYIEDSQHRAWTVVALETHDANVDDADMPGTQRPRD